MLCRITQPLDAASYIGWWGAAGGGTDRTDQFEINAVADGYGATIGAKTYIRFKTDGLGATDERMRIACLTAKSVSGLLRQHGIQRFINQEERVVGSQHSSPRHCM